MIFQEPMTSLNPLMTVGQQARERCAGTSRWGAARSPGAPARCSTRCACRTPKRLAQYPHELSGGMRQR